jgi:hypothetical protein
MMGKGGVEPHRPTTADDDAPGAWNFRRVEGCEVGWFAYPPVDVEL